MTNPDLSPRKKPVQDRSRHLVESVVEATRRLVLREGFESLTMARIAKVAGVSPGSLYQYFPSVDSLMVVLYQRMRTQEIEAFERLLESTRAVPLRESIEAFLFELAKMLAEQRPLAAELAKWVPILDPEEEKIAPIDARLTELMTAFLRERDHETRPLDPELAGMMLARSILGVVRHALIEQPELAGDRRLFEELVLLVHGFVRRV